MQIRWFKMGGESGNVIGGGGFICFVNVAV